MPRRTNTNRLAQSKAIRSAKASQIKTQGKSASPKQIRGEKTVGGHSKPGPSKDYTTRSTTAPKARGSALKGIGRIAARVAAPVGIAITGYQVGKAIGESLSNRKTSSGGQMSRNKPKVTVHSGNAAKHPDYDKIQAHLSKPKATSTTPTPKKPKAQRKSATSRTTSGSAKPTSKKRDYPNPTAGYKMGSQKDADQIVKAYKPKKASKPKKKVNRGYQNYVDIMSAEGLKDGGYVNKSQAKACGGKVMKKADGGRIYDMLPESAKAWVREQQRKQYTKPRSPARSNNQPKASGDNYKPKTPGGGGAAYVPHQLMKEIEKTRGYEGGGLVQGPRNDMYGSYDGGGGSSPHRNITTKTKITRS